MGIAVTLKDFRGPSFLHRWYHKLFKCPTFWMLQPRFKCPGCAKTYRCYWDGNDVEGYGIDYCGRCARKLEIRETERKGEEVKE